MINKQLTHIPKLKFQLEKKNEELRRCQDQKRKKHEEFLTLYSNAAAMDRETFDRQVEAKDRELQLLREEMKVLREGSVQARDDVILFSAVQLIFTFRK